MQATRLIRRALPLILLGAAGVAAARRRMKARELGPLLESPLGGPAGEAGAPAGGPLQPPVGPLTEAEGPAGTDAIPDAGRTEADAPAEVEDGIGVPTVVDADPAGPTVVDVEVLPDAPEPEAGLDPEPDAEPTPEQEPKVDAEAPTTEVPAIEEPPTSVTDIVDDLIAPDPAADERIEDATVVEADEPGDPSDGVRERP